MRSLRIRIFPFSRHFILGVACLCFLAIEGHCSSGLISPISITRDSKGIPAHVSGFPEGTLIRDPISGRTWIVGKDGTLTETPSRK